MTEDGEYDEQYCTMKSLLIAVPIGIIIWAVAYLVWRLV